MSDPYFVVGNAIREGKEYKDWFFGQFMPESSHQHSRDLEVKWGVHAKGEKCTSSHTPNEKITTMTILVRGKIQATFDGKTYSLENEGDYLLWSHNLPHTSEMLEDTTCITIRWPSIPPR